MIRSKECWKDRKLYTDMGQNWIEKTDDCQELNQRPTGVEDENPKSRVTVAVGLFLISSNDDDIIVFLQSQIDYLHRYWSWENQWSNSNQRSPDVLYKWCAADVFSNRIAFAFARTMIAQVCKHPIVRNGADYPDLLNHLSRALFHRGGEAAILNYGSHRWSLLIVIFAMNRKNHGHGRADGNLRLVSKDAAVSKWDPEKPSFQLKTSKKTDESEWDYAWNH